MCIDFCLLLATLTTVIGITVLTRSRMKLRCLDQGQTNWSVWGSNLEEWRCEFPLLLPLSTEQLYEGTNLILIPF